MDPVWVSEADRIEYQDRFTEGDWFIVYIKGDDLRMLAQGIVTDAVRETAARVLKP